MRYLFLAFAGVIVAYFCLLQPVMQRSSEKPVFLREDTIANAHVTNITTKVHSRYKPTTEQLASLVSDYAALWAHLNLLYANGDVEKGKEYYTEAWFNNLCSHYKGVMPVSAQRFDLQHDLHIINWSSDALVCNAIDSNVVFRYQYPDKKERYTCADIAIVLLFQGDHWRVDAMRMINEY